MKGRNIATMIDVLERETGAPIARSFDLVVGTSIGGCGALFVNRFGDEALAPKLAFARLQTRCFEPRRKHHFFLKGHTCVDERSELVRELCGDERLGTDDATFAEAVAATSAAPTFFPRPTHWYYGGLRQVQGDYGRQGIRDYTKPVAEMQGSIMPRSNTDGAGRGSYNEDRTTVIGGVINHARSPTGTRTSFHYHGTLAAGENTLEAQLSRLLAVDAAVRVARVTRDSKPLERAAAAVAGVLFDSVHGVGTMADRVDAATDALGMSRVHAGAPDEMIS
ncbi:ADP-ribosylglycohydrolase [Aureococcus anophagefferens]|nr:ADP-ribosylglycohydrolase [Aureococcus anophagefferens]